MEKKTKVHGTVRVSEREDFEFAEALEYYSVTRTSFYRHCMRALVKAFRERQEIPVPVQFRAFKIICPECHVEIPLPIEKNENN